MIPLARQWETMDIPPAYLGRHRSAVSVYDSFTRLMRVVIKPVQEPMVTFTWAEPKGAIENG